MKMNKKEKIFHICVSGIFALYLGILFIVIVLKFPTGLVSNTIKGWMKGAEVARLTPQLIPFKTIIPYIQQARAITDWFVKNLACNIIMFMTYGFLYPFVMEKSIQKNCRRTILSAFILSVCIEIFQYISAFGHCDIDDVILNTVGAAIGYGLYLIAVKIINRIFS